jgi:hypothetical protein
MAFIYNSSYVQFKEVTQNSPSEGEIRRGVYAMSKMSGDLVKIPRCFTGRLSASAYSCYAMADAFPSSSKYAPTYDDLVRAKEILKEGRCAGWGDPEVMGKAIGLIKRFLDTHGKI